LTYQVLLFWNIHRDDPFSNAVWRILFFYHITCIWLFQTLLLNVIGNTLTFNYKNIGINLDSFCFI